MEITIQGLLKSDFFSKASLQAGEKGFANRIISVTVLDSPDGVEYLKGGELVLTSGYCFTNDEKSQKMVIEKLANKGAAGLAMTLRFFNGKMPRTIKETADKMNFPIIILPEGFAYVDINEFINSYRARSLQQVFKEINNSLYTEGLSGMAQVLNLHTGLQVIVLFGENRYVYPVGYQIPDFLLNKALWYRKDKSNLKSTDVDLFTREVSGKRYEWLSSDFKIKGTESGRIILLKGENDFPDDAERVLDYASSVCALEVSFIKSLISIQRKHRKEFLETLFSGNYSKEEAIKQAEKLNYSIPDEGIVIIFSSAQEIEDINEDKVEFCVKNIFGNKVVQGMVEINNYLIFTDYNEETINLVNKLYNEIIKEYSRENITVGIGRPATFENISQSYHEAKAAIRIGSCFELGTQIYEFNNLGFYRLLFSKNLENEIIRFYEDYLKPLELNDSEHNTDLMETLKYLVNAKYRHRVAAADMFVHPNTIRYRIKIIEKLCRINLELPDNRFLMEIALKLLPLIKKKQKKDL